MRRGWLALWLLMGCLPTQPSGTGPIQAAASEWTWVEFVETLCADGQATGLGINPSSDAADAVIYLSGGPACWDATTCSTISTGYTASKFGADSGRQQPLFDRSRADNPFRAAHFVWLPSCTGDLHIGTTQQAYQQGVPTHHSGARNLEAFLSRLSPTFASSKRVFVVGVDTGGLGATMNAHRFRAAFPSAEVHVLADSSALVPPSEARWKAWSDAWQPASPPTCLQCATTPSAWVTAARTALGSGRLALVTSDATAPLALLLGRSEQELRDGVKLLVDAEYRTPRSAAFVVPGSRSGLLSEWNGVSVNGVTLEGFLRSFRDGEGFTTP